MLSNTRTRLLLIVFLYLGNSPFANSDTTLIPVINFLLQEDASSSIFGAQPVASTPLDKGTLFTAPDGNGNTCSIALPCDIQTAIAQLSAGSVLFLRGGRYVILSHLNVVSSGTAEQPIIIESYPGELAILDGQNQTPADIISGNFPTGPGLWVHTDNNYISIRKIEVKNRATGERHNLTEDEFFNFYQKKAA